METREFIDKLKAINLKDLNNKGHLINGKWKVKYRYEQDLRATNTMPSVRLVVQVYYDEVHAQSWGCVSEESQREILKILLNAKANAERENWRKEDQAREVAKLMFKNLGQ